MYTVLLVIHIMVTIALIAVVLVQRSASDGVLSSSSSTSFMSGRAAASFITRATAVLGTIFILSSLALGFLLTHNRANTGSSIIDKLNTAPTTTSAPASTEPTTTPVAPKEPVKPSVPRP